MVWCHSFSRFYCVCCVVAIENLQWIQFDSIRFETIELFSQCIVRQSEVTSNSNTSLMLLVAMFRSSRFSRYSFIITSFCLFTQIAIIVRSLDYDLFESMIAHQEVGKGIAATSTNPTTYSTTEGNRSDLFTSVFGFGILEYRQSVVMITSHSKKQIPLESFAYEIPRNRLKSDKLPLFDFPAVPMIKKWFSVRPCRNCDVSGYAKLPNCTEVDKPVSPDPMKACNFLMTNAEIYRTLILQWDNFDRVWINFCIGPYPIENDGQNITILDLNAYPYSYESQFGCYYIFPWILYRSPTNRTLATYEETMYYTVDGSRINKLFAVINFDLGIPLDIQLRWDFHITCYGSPHRRTIYLFDSSECVNGSAYRFHWTDITTGYVGRELTYLFGYGQVIVFASSVFRNRSPLGAVTFRRFTFEQFFWTPDDSGPDNSSQPHRSHLRLSRTSIALLAMLPVVLIIAISLVIIYCIYNGRAKPIRAAVVAGKSSTRSRSDALAKQQQAEQQKTSMLEGNAPSNVENNSAQEVATPIMSSKISGKSKSAANQISECQNVKSKSRSQMNISRLTKLDSISNADNNSNKRKKSKKKKNKKKEIKSKSSKIGSKIKKSKKSSMRKSSQKSGVGGSQISSPNKLKMASTKSKSKKNKKVATKSGKIAGSSIRSAKKSSRQESSRIAKGTNSFRSTKALSAAFPAFSSVQQQKDSQSKCVSSKKKNKKKKKPETATSSKKKGGSKSMKKATKTSAVAGEIDPASMSFNKANTTATTISNSFKVSAKSVKKKDKKKKKEKTKKSEKKPKERAKSSKKGKPAPLSKKAISSAFPRSSNKIANNNTNTNFGKTKSKSKSMNPAISAAAKSKKNDNSKKSVKNKQKAKSKSKKK